MLGSVLPENLFRIHLLSSSQLLGAQGTLQDSDQVSLGFCSSHPNRLPYSARKSSSFQDLHEAVEVCLESPMVDMEQGIYGPPEFLYWV